MTVSQVHRIVFPHQVFFIIVLMCSRVLSKSYATYHCSPSCLLAVGMLLSCSPFQVQSGVWTTSKGSQLPGLASGLSWCLRPVRPHFLFSWSFGLDTFFDPLGLDTSGLTFLALLVHHTYLKCQN